MCYTFYGIKREEYMKLSTTATYGLRICFLLAVADKMLSLSSLVEQTVFAQFSEYLLEIFFA